MADSNYKQSEINRWKEVSSSSSSSSSGEDYTNTSFEGDNYPSNTTTTGASERPVIVNNFHFDFKLTPDTLLSIMDKPLEGYEYYNGGRMYGGPPNSGAPPPYGADAMYTPREQCSCPDTADHGNQYIEVGRILPLLTTCNITNVIIPCFYKVSNIILLLSNTSQHFVASHLEYEIEIE